jgi:TonB family protein
VDTKTWNTTGAETINRIFARQPRAWQTKRSLILAAGFASLVGATAVLVPGLKRANDKPLAGVSEPEDASLPRIVARRIQAPVFQQPVTPEQQTLDEIQSVTTPSEENLLPGAVATTLDSVNSVTELVVDSGQPATDERTTPVEAASSRDTSSGSALPTALVPAQQVVASSNSAATNHQSSDAARQSDATASARLIVRGVATPARRQAGTLLNSDYPREAKRAKAEGTVSVSYKVGADGSVGGCTVTKSSGREDLDRTTCRVIEERFRYAPARDAIGEPVEQTMTRSYDWFLKSKR